MYKIIIEQTYDYPQRMKYNPDTNTFSELNYTSLLKERSVTFPYGWLKESGTPPNEHLDVILISRKHCELGDEFAIKIIGVFKRYDNDHKLVAVCAERQEIDLTELADDEKNELFKLYPRINPDVGEGWFGAEIANEVINDFMKNGRIRK
jgi:inorganic pyrophosphatase